VTITVIVADDHAIVRDGLRMLLDSQADISVDGVAATGREAVRLIEKVRPHVAVMDISMPDLNGIEAIQQLAPRFPDLRFVVLSIHAARPYVDRALRAGAHAYLIKETAGLKVVEAVRAVSRGERFLSRRIDDMLAAAKPGGSDRGEGAGGPLETLSPREREVLQLVAEGKTSQEIAGTLSISPKTVDSYRSRLMAKIGVSDIPGLVKFAIRQGVISLE
jgi:DNA-binding NarL/FixJ family response regulator